MTDIKNKDIKTTYKVETKSICPGFKYICNKELDSGSWICPKCMSESTRYQAWGFTIDEEDDDDIVPYTQYYYIRHLRLLQKAGHELSNEEEELIKTY